MNKHFFGPDDDRDEDEPQIVTEQPKAGSGEDISPSPDYKDIYYPDEEEED